jgi:hypothetical protein
VRTVRLSLSTIVLAVALTVAGAAQADLDPKLGDLEPYVGRTYQGAFVDAATGEEAVDVQKWEAILGGKAVRVVHSLNEGEYGGETIIFWDSARSAVAYYYFTTAGFFTHGTMTFEPGAVTAHEMVDGNTDGITEVRSTSRILEDGRLHLRSEFLKDGEWVPGHEIHYTEAPQAEVVFK